MDANYFQCLQSITALDKNLGYILPSCSLAHWNNVVSEHVYFKIFDIYCQISLKKLCPLMLSWAKREESCCLCGCMLDAAGCTELSPGHPTSGPALSTPLRLPLACAGISTPPSSPVCWLWALEWLIFQQHVVPTQSWCLPVSQARRRGPEEHSYTGFAGWKNTCCSQIFQVARASDTREVVMFLSITYFRSFRDSHHCNG
jgi:hypothetical protein